MAQQACIRPRSASPQLEPRESCGLPLLMERSVREAELLQLFAQSRTIDSQNARGSALVALRVVEHYPEQRLLDLAQHEIVELGRPVTVQAHEVVAQRTLRVIAQRQLPAAELRPGTVASSTLLSCCHVRSSRNQAACEASPTHRSKYFPARANCAAVLAASMRSRRACAESGKHCSQYQPRCLRAIRTPVSSP